MQRNHRYRLLGLACVLALALQGCASNAEAVQPNKAETSGSAKTGQSAPSDSVSTDVAWPKDKLEAGENGAPMLDVYVADAEKVERIDAESYVACVLAGEMKNDWPLEALKAQAILARTFVLKFVAEKESKYPNADISTDIEEAQAYDPSAVNDRIRQAVEETRGMVLSSNGELIYAWFHAHSGGLTERAVAGLNWDKDEPAYTQVVKSNEPESVQNEKDAQTLADARAWEASFPAKEFEAACKKQGVSVDVSADTKLEIAERGESGRAIRLSADGQEVGAAELRIALGSTKMRSTLLTSLTMDGDAVSMAGKGYGHGVGMSQWGAYGMALEGSAAEEIVTHFFNDVRVARVW